MFAYLKGHIILKTPTYVHVECGGVGYLVNISLHTYEAIERLSEAKIYTYLHITEDAHTIYGFFTEDEKELFLQLISVQGVGASTARLFLSSFAPKDLQRAIINGEIGLLKSVKGIGLKTAQRIILELKDKLGKRSLQPDSASGMLSGRGSSSIAEEALSALSVLGFQKSQAEKVVLGIMKDNTEDITVEQLIKQSLKSL